jgi:hypothetical protein
MTRISGGWFSRHFRFGRRAQQLRVLRRHSTATTKPISLPKVRTAAELKREQSKPKPEDLDNKTE